MFLPKSMTKLQDLAESLHINFRLKKMKQALLDAKNILLFMKSKRCVS
jgi:hypothetical protein